MFSGKDDVDFVVKSNSNGSTFNGQYYIEGDTLFEIPQRKIALKDIEFKAIDVYRNVFNKIGSNDPYVLVLKPMANRFTYYYGNQSRGQIDLYLPNQPYAEQTFAYLKKLSQGGAAPTPAVVTDNKPGPAEVCKSTVIFLNDLLTTNLSSYLGNKISEDMGFRSFNSTVAFPLAIETTIMDTNSFQPDYRSAEALMMKETMPTEELSAEMKELYTELCGILKKCLEHNGFEYKNKDDDPFHLYKLQTEYSRYLPVDPNVFLSALQTRRGLIVNVRVLQNKSGEGSYTNKLIIYFKGQ